MLTVMAQMTREELYNLVWQIPMTRLATQFGISNVALGKLCRRRNIPTPGRGYWARLAAGGKQARPPLPNVKGFVPPLDLTRDSDAVARAQQPNEERPPLPLVHVPDTLENATEVVRRVAKLLAKAPVDQHERLIVGNFLCATAFTHRRALLVLDGLVRTFEQRGHKVVVSGKRRAATLDVCIAGERVGLSITELLGRVEHKATPEEQERIAKGQARRIPKYDQHPCDRLSVEVYDGEARYECWSDTEKGRLERKLGHVVMAVEAIPVRRAERRAEDERRQAESEARQRREAEERAREGRQQRLREYHQLITDDLERMAAAWAHAKQVRDFLDAYAAAVPDGQRDDVARAWLAAARRYAGLIDPLLAPERIPRAMDPDANELEFAISELKELNQQRTRPTYPGVSRVA